MFVDLLHTCTIDRGDDHCPFIDFWPGHKSANGQQVLCTSWKFMYFVAVFGSRQESGKTKHAWTWASTSQTCQESMNKEFVLNQHCPSPPLKANDFRVQCSSGNAATPNARKGIRGASFCEPATQVVWFCVMFFYATEILMFISNGREFFRLRRPFSPPLRPVAKPCCGCCACDRQVIRFWSSRNFSTIGLGGGWLDRVGNERRLAAFVCKYIMCFCLIICGKYFIVFDFGTLTSHLKWHVRCWNLRWTELFLLKSKPP